MMCREREHEQVFTWLDLTTYVHDIKSFTTYKHIGYFELYITKNSIYGIYKNYMKLNMIILKPHNFMILQKHDNPWYSTKPWFTRL